MLKAVTWLGVRLGAAFGRLVVGLILPAVFAGRMMARGQTGPPIFGPFSLGATGHSNNAFQKPGAVSRTVDAGSRTLSGVRMIGARWVLGTAPKRSTDPVAGGGDAAKDRFVVINHGGGFVLGSTQGREQRHKMVFLRVADAGGRGFVP